MTTAMRARQERSQPKGECSWPEAISRSVGATMNFLPRTAFNRPMRCKLEAAATALVALAACTPQYDPCFPLASEVRGLQVLSVRTDPPEAVLRDDGSAPPVAVRALVVDPAAPTGAKVDLSAAACVPTDDRRCAASPSVSTRGDPGPQSFTIEPGAALLQEALQADPLQGYGGLRVQLHLSAIEGAQEASAEKLLLYAPPGGEPNHGFEIVGLRVRRFAFSFHEDNNVPKPPAEQVLAPGEPLQMDVGDPVWLEPVLAPGAGATEPQELYETTTLDGKRLQLREQIGYTFYSTQHTELDPPESGEPEPGAARPVNGLSRLRYLKMGGGPARVYVVARDTRGAQAWLEVPVFARDLRGCAEVRHCPLIEFGCE